jgi:26S proteasome regulatory subunit N5
LISTSRVLVKIIQFCYNAKDWKLINENLVLLSKKRGQLKQARTAESLMKHILI